MASATDYAEAHRRFRYDPETGVLHYRIKTRSRAIGAEVGSLSTRGYRQVYLRGRNHLVHRVIWLMVHGSWPADEIDHRDTDRLNNRLDNLRAATSGQNKANSRPHKDNRTGFKGIYFNRARGRYRAQIQYGLRPKHLGYFDTPEEAHRAYRAAAELHFGDFARAE